MAADPVALHFAGEGMCRDITVRRRSSCELGRYRRPSG